MKVLVVLLLVLAAVVGYMYVINPSASNPTPEPVEEAQTHQAYWEEPIPAGTELVEKTLPRFNVVTVRRSDTPQNILEFQITEEHGFMVDGIRIEFWYCFVDDETGELIEDVNSVEHVCTKRLGFNETLVDSTPLIDDEFRYLGIDLAETTSENWKARVMDFARAMKPAN